MRISINAEINLAMSMLTWAPLEGAEKYTGPWGALKYTYVL